MMRKFYIALLAILIASPLCAQQVTQGVPGVGQLPGTATNDSASAGNVGEYVTATASGVSLTTNTPANITSISLTAGEWDVTCSVQFAVAATTTVSWLRAGTGTTSASINGTAGNYAEQAYSPGSAISSEFPTFSTPMSRLQLTGTTTVFCVAHAFFATSTMTASAMIRARRVR